MNRKKILIKNSTPLKESCRKKSNLITTDIYLDYFLTLPTKWEIERTEYKQSDLCFETFNLIENSSKSFSCSKMQS